MSNTSLNNIIPPPIATNDNEFEPKQIPISQKWKNFVQQFPMLALRSALLRGVTVATLLCMSYVAYRSSRKTKPSLPNAAIVVQADPLRSQLHIVTVAPISIPSDTIAAIPFATDSISVASEATATMPQKSLPISAQKQEVLVVAAPSDSIHAHKYIPSKPLLASQKIKDNQMSLAMSAYSLPHFNKDVRPALAYNGQDPILTAEKWIWKGDYIVAKSILDSIGASKPDYFAAQRLLGHLFFKTGKIPAATRIFQRLSNVKDPKIADAENEWYLLLCYLAQFHLEKNNFDALATTIINQPKHPYHKALDNLLAKIKVLKTEGKL